MIEWDHDALSVTTQCALLGLPRSTLYYEPRGESALNLELMRRIDRLYTDHPFYGSPKMTVELRKQGYPVNHKRVERLMQLMGLHALCPKRPPTLSSPGHRIFPYLLRNVEIVRVNQVWGADITYIPLQGGFLYLVAILDWFSRYVLSWELSNTMDAAFCVRALRRALRRATPEIFNTDQGSQFSSEAFTALLTQHHVAQSMDGRGRVFDNIFNERLWRTVKYENVYLMDYTDGHETHRGLSRYFEYYDLERPHQSLDYQTPYEVYARG